MHSALDQVVDNSPTWYVVQCRKSKEEYVARWLREYFDLMTYLPEVIGAVPDTMQPAPLFPGYVFVQMDLHDINWPALNTTRYIVGLVEFDSKPATLPDVVVCAIREQVEDMNAAGGLPTHSFEVNDTVLFRNGPFRGQQALFLGPTNAAKRVKVLLYLLGRHNEISVDIKQLEPTSPNERRQPDGYKPRSRGTRGGGRAIRPSQANVPRVRDTPDYGVT